MKKSSEANDSHPMRDEYDFSGGVRGKYASRYAEGTNLVRLDPDIAEIFPTSESVNQALRALAEIAKRQRNRLTSKRVEKAW